MDIYSLIVDKFSLFVNFIESFLFFNIISFWTDTYQIPFLIFILTFFSLYFAIFLRFLNFKSIFDSLKYFFNKNESKETGSIKSLMFAAIGSNIDISSIFAVSTVVLFYGPGVVFWILAGGLIATGVNFFEIYCGHKFRSNGNEEHFEPHSGTTLYIKKSFEYLKIPMFGKALAVIFSLGLISASFFSGQMNQVVRTVHFFSSNIITVDRWIVSLILSIFIGLTVSGGFARIVNVSKNIVPLMSLLYIIVTIMVYFVNRNNIFYALSEIYNNIFHTKALTGGVLSMVIMGFQRSFFCTEAGLGTAPLLHTGSSNDDPIIEAKKSISVPLISSLILCFCSGVMVIISKAHINSDDGFLSMVNAIDTVSKNFHYILLIVIPLFGFSTAIAWGYYGQTVWVYLFGNKKITRYLYIILFSISYFICGTVEDFALVLRASDAVSLSIAIPNILSLFILSFFLGKDIKNEIKK